MSVFIPAGSGRLTTAWAGLATQPMTVCCWFWLPVATPSASLWRDIVVLEPNVYLQTFSDGITMDFGSYGQDHTGQLLAINTWYHAGLVVVPTSTTNRQHYGYVNGALQVNATDTTTFTAYTGFTVGNSTFAGNTYALNGNVRDVKIWNRALSATEIEEEMVSSMPIHDQGLLVWSPFDDDLYTDRSGNGRIWTSAGTPVCVQQGGFHPRGMYSQFAGRSMTRF
jgi:hypothetical protein